LAAHTLSRVPSPESAPATPASSEQTAPRNTREWFESLYYELRRRARGELFRQQVLTVGATTLVHEAWLRLDGRPLEFASQAELVAYSGRVMRSLVIDHIRSRRAAKHGGEYELVPYDTMLERQAMKDDDALRVDEGLRDLAATDPRLAELVELHFFAGLTFVEIAALRGLSERTVQRDWEKARMLLFTALKG
jgi:RNA polymerase sigma factor (TIGR02999 family)